jgi:hypothetical protein
MMDQKGSDSFGEKLIQLMLLRSMEGESTIQESIQWNRETKGIVPLVQAGGLLAGLIVTAIGFGIVFGALDALNRGDPGGRTQVMIGLVVAIPGILLAYRQGRDLLDPFGKTSPMERMLRPHIANMLMGPQEEAEEGTPPRIFPARNAQDVRALSPAPKERLPCHPLPGKRRGTEPGTLAAGGGTAGNTAFNRNADHPHSLRPAHRGLGALGIRNAWRRRHGPRVVRGTGKGNRDPQSRDRAPAETNGVRRILDIMNQVNPANEQASNGGLLTRCEAR